MLALVFSFVALAFAITAWFKAGEALKIAEDALFTAALVRTKDEHSEMAAWNPNDDR
jgi:hypothetical protein